MKSVDVSLSNLLHKTFGVRVLSQGDQAKENQSDSVLLGLLQHGQQDAATELYRRYADRLLLLAGKRSSDRLATRVDAEDIVQSVFRTFFRRASAGHYALPDGEELWKLFLVISLNKIRKKADFHTAIKRDVGRTQAIGQHQIASQGGSDDILRLTIEELICALPKEHQAVISDRIQGYEVAEMAERHQLSKRTIERILQSFRRRLKEQLEVDNDDQSRPS